MKAGSYDDASDLRGERSFGLAGVALFSLVALLVAADVGADLGHGASVAHLATEIAAAVLALAGALLFAVRLLGLARGLRDEGRRLQSQAADLSARLTETRAQAERWRAESEQLIQGLSAAIDRQLQRWELTPAEQQVAWLLLKGLSHGEVAAARSVSERTVRQQAQAVYRKAGLGGRAELSAFFLEDLLQPQPVAE